ncbi:MAG: hypothetical protein K0U78_15445 [Actinomycetia bacterium]|nr:hypothetical protein [Actinomycetes bacterium]
MILNPFVSKRLIAVSLFSGLIITEIIVLSRFLFLLRFAYETDYTRFSLKNKLFHKISQNKPKTHRIKESTKTHKTGQKA